MKRLIVSVLAFGPMVAFAQQPDLSYLSTLLNTIKGLVRNAIPLVMGLALLAFLWGVFKFIWGGEEKREEGKQLMLWGVVGLFVMASVWGLVQFLGTVTGVKTTGGSIPVPTVQQL